MTVPSSGLHLAALSSRLVTARSRPGPSPTTYQGASLDVEGQAGRAAADPRDHPVDELGQVDRLDHVGQRLVAGQLDQVADQRGQLLDLGVHVVEQLGPRLAAAARRRSASTWLSRSRLVRSEVSGVRSSWPASATSWRCRSREAASAASIWLNAVASRAISSSPSTGSGRRSSVRAMCSAGVGEPADRAQAVAGHAPAGDARRRSRRRGRRAASRCRACASSASWESSDWAMTIVLAVVAVHGGDRGSGCRRRVMVRTRLRRPCPWRRRPRARRASFGGSSASRRDHAPWPAASMQATQTSAAPK